MCTASFLGIMKETERLASLLNVFAVKYYGESEFWLALGKLILAVGLLAFTFVTMVGGNPLHDAYGFRFWNRESSGIVAKNKALTNAVYSGPC